MSVLAIWQLVGSKKSCPRSDSGAGDGTNKRNWIAPKDDNDNNHNSVLPRNGFFGAFCEVLEEGKGGGDAWAP